MLGGCFSLSCERDGALGSAVVLLPGAHGRLVVNHPTVAARSVRRPKLTHPFCTLGVTVSFVPDGWCVSFSRLKVDNGDVGVGGMFLSASLVTF
jgi:hypothetical protein